MKIEEDSEGVLSTLFNRGDLDSYLEDLDENVYGDPEG